jgi:hypothetical protein
MGKSYFGKKFRDYDSRLPYTSAKHPWVRNEQAGIMGRITCQWDNVTGEHLSTTALVYVIGQDGIVPTPTDETYERGCAVIKKCLSCPKRAENQPPEQA